MNLQEYQQKKAAIMNAYRQRQLGFVKSMQAAKAHMKATLAEARTQVNFNLANMPRVNHDAFIRRHSHNVCRFLKKRLAEMKWDAQEFEFDPENLQMSFDIDKENNKITWQFSVPTIKH